MKRWALLLLVPLLLAARPAPAPPAPPPSVRLGVEKWRVGDYPAAVAMWMPFAASGDMDALFNMGQAYKLGRGVPRDLTQARDYYRKAAVKGSLPAQANLGILLFQAGEKPEAMRWLAAAADRGEIRAQYVLGVAAYNGDGVRRNVPLGYAYLLRASAGGLAQATTALGPIAPALSYYDRANGETIAASLAAGQGVPPAFALNAVPPMLAATQPAPTPPAMLRPQPGPVAAPAPAARPVPKPDAAAALASDRPAVAAQPNAPVVTPTPTQIVPTQVPKPATMADAVTPAAPVAAPTSPAPRPAPTPVVVAKVEVPAATINPTPAPKAEVPKPEAPKPEAAKTVSPKPTVASADAVKAVAKPETPKPAKTAAIPAAKPQPPTSWRIQLGAYATRTQADKVWAEVKAKQRDLLGDAKPLFESGDTIVKLQIGPYPSRDSARAACSKLSAAGRACFTVAPGR